MKTFSVITGQEVWKKCGHPRTLENTSRVSVVRPGGQCRICALEKQHQYEVSPNGRKRHRQYEGSPKGRKRFRRYRASEVGQRMRSRYSSTAASVLSHIRNNAKQREENNVD